MPLSTDTVLNRKAVRVKNIKTGVISTRVIPYGKTLALGNTVNAVNWYEYQTKYDEQNRDYGALPICGTSTMPGSPLNELYDSADYELSITDTNTPPTVGNPALDVVIIAFGVFTIPAPVGEFVDNVGDTFQLIPSLRVTGSDVDYPLPIGLTFDYTTGTFTGTADFTNRTMILRRTYVDSAGQKAVDDFQVIVNRPIRAAIDVRITSGTVEFFFRTPAASVWQAKLEYVGHFAGSYHDMSELTIPDSQGFQFGESIGPSLPANDIILISISPDGISNEITRSVTVPAGGNLARTNLYLAAT